MNAKDFTTAAAGLFLLTFSTVAEPTADEVTNYLTADRAEALAIVAQLAAEGSPLYHVTIKTA